MPHFRHFGLLTTLFCLLVLSVWGQASTISGSTTDTQSTEPLINVTIKVKETASGTLSNVNGNYELKLQPGIYTLIASYVGYNSEAVTLTLHANEKLKYDFKLNENKKQLQEVTISGSKFEKNIGEETVSMAVLKPNTMEAASLTRVDDALKRMPGVDVVDGQANIRGGSGWSYGAGSRVLVMVDDMPMLTADAGDAKWEFLPVENCEQVEVIKGAASALYGSSALNGVIHFRTAFPRSKPQTNISIVQGLYDTPGQANMKWWGNDLQTFTNLSFFHSQKFGHLDVVAGGNYFTDDSYLEGGYSSRARGNLNLRYRFKKIEGLSIGINTNAQVAKGSTFFLWGADDHMIVYNTKPYLSRPDSTYMLRPSGGIDTPKTTLSSYNSHKINIDPYITYQTKNAYKLSLRNRFYYSDNINNSNQSSIGRLYYSEFQIQHTFTFQIHAVAGLVTNYSSVSSMLFSDHQAANQAAYIQLEKKFGKRFWLSGGGRYETGHLDSLQYKSKPLGRIGFNYQLGAATWLRASAGMGFRYPSIAEKFVSTSISVVGVYPNKNLKAERGWSSELGARQGYAFGKWMGFTDVAAFYTRYDSMMEFTFNVIDKNHTGFQSRNVANTLIYGIDASTYMKGMIGHMSFEASGGFTYNVPLDLGFDTAKWKTTFSYSDSVHNVLKYRYTTSAKGDIEFGWHRFTLGSYCRYNSYVVNIDRVFTFLFPSIKQYMLKKGTQGDWLLDFRMGYRLTDQATASFILKNAMNRTYIERPAYLAPPRTFNIQFVYKF